MKRVCAFCKNLFKEDAMVSMTVVDFILLSHKQDKEMEFFTIKDSDYGNRIEICEPCYEEKSGIRKQFESHPSTLKDKCPSLKFLEIKTYKTSYDDPTKSDDKVMVTFCCNRYEWQYIAGEFKGV